MSWWRVALQLLLVSYAFDECRCGEFYKLNTRNAMTETILSDIRNAFKIVTNNTRILNRLIPTMYNLSAKHIVFELSNETGSGSSMLLMQRSDFTEPTFPNISTQYMKMMKKRRQGSISSVVSLESGKDAWSALGLDGWSGTISHPVGLLESSHKDMQVDGGGGQKYPTDFSLGEVDGFAQDIETTTMKEQFMDMTANESNLNTNVYIARVNDPFGHSTKWPLRNSSDANPFSWHQFNSSTEDRPKRDVVKLYSMIKCSTGCEPLAYKGYGCYCGFLGAGIPVNGIDRCCKLHDKCYEQSNCISYLEYFVPYVWKCYRGKPLCAIDHGEWGGPTSCAARLCYCDLRLSRCLRKFNCPHRRAVCTSSTARKLQNLFNF